MQIPESKLLENKKFSSHGDGQWSRSDFARIGDHVILEPGVLVFHAENIDIGENVYIGHRTMLKGYYRNRMVIGDGSWIGQDCFLHSAGGILIGRFVGIGPKVSILTSQHRPADANIPVLHAPVEFAPVVLEDGCDIGVNATILPGVTVGKGAIVGAGAVVNRDIPPYEVWGGVPARKIGVREGNGHP